MGRYPFREACNRFLEEYKHYLRKSTWSERERALRRLTKDFEALAAEGKISSLEPSKMTAEDIKQYYVVIRERGLGSKSLEHHLGFIHSLCMFCGNDCVEKARHRFPMIRFFAPRKRLGTIPYDVIERILAEGLKKDTFDHSRDYAVVILSMCAGLRPIELQHALRDHIDLESGEIYIVETKGKGTYGEPRKIPIQPRGLPMIRKYVELRDKTKLGYDYLFPCRKHGRPISTNTLRGDKDVVQEEIGYELTFQSCRRTYGQWLIDDGVPTPTVSLLMGHSNTKTTEKYYARQREEDAIKIAKKIWELRAKKEEAK